jgi:hypothetical protein
VNYFKRLLGLPLASPPLENFLGSFSKFVSACRRNAAASEMIQ